MNIWLIIECLKTKTRTQTIHTPNGWTHICSHKKKKKLRNTFRPRLWETYFFKEHLLQPMKPLRKCVSWWTRKIPKWDKSGTLSLKIIHKCMKKVDLYTWSWNKSRAIYLMSKKNKKQERRLQSDLLDLMTNKQLQRFKLPT